MLSQELGRSRPREAGRLGVVRIRPVFLEEPVPGPRVHVDLYLPALVAEAPLELFDGRFVLVRIRFGEVAEECRSRFLEFSVPRSIVDDHAAELRTPLAREPQSVGSAQGKSDQAKRAVRANAISQVIR